MNKEDGMKDEASKNNGGWGDWDGDRWWEDRSLPEKVGIGMGLALLGVGLFVLYGWLVMSLWNWLMPDIFGLKRLDYWQALGLPALIMLLFLGVGGGEKSSSGDRKRKRNLKRYLRSQKCEPENTGDAVPEAKP